MASLVFVLALVGCGGTDCINGVKQELVSPDGKMKVVVFSRNCGATTGFNTQASVLEKEAKLPDEAGNAVIVDQGAATISWNKEGGILVVIEAGARVLKKESTVSGISVEYREKPRS